MRTERAKTLITLSFLFFIGIFLLVGLGQTFLHRFRIRKHGIIAAKARRLRHNAMVNRKATAFDFDGSFFSDQFDNFLSPGAADKIHLQG